MIDEEHNQLIFKKVLLDDFVGTTVPQVSVVVTTEGKEVESSKVELHTYDDVETERYYYAPNQNEPDLVVFTVIGDKDIDYTPLSLTLFKDLTSSVNLDVSQSTEVIDNSNDISGNKYLTKYHFMVDLSVFSDSNPELYQAYRDGEDIFAYISGNGHIIRGIINCPEIIEPEKVLTITPSHKQGDVIEIKLDYENISPSSVIDYLVTLSSGSDELTLSYNDGVMMINDNLIINIRLIDRQEHPLISAAIANEETIYVKVTAVLLTEQVVESEAVELDCSLDPLETDGAIEYNPVVIGEKLEFNLYTNPDVEASDIRVYLAAPQYGSFEIMDFEMSEPKNDYSYDSDSLAKLSKVITIKLDDVYVLDNDFYQYIKSSDNVNIIITYGDLTNPTTLYESFTYEKIIEATVNENISNYTIQGTVEGYALLTDLHPEYECYEVEVVINNESGIYRATYLVNALQSEFSIQVLQNEPYECENIQSFIAAFQIAVDNQQEVIVSINAYNSIEYRSSDVIGVSYIIFNKI